MREASGARRKKFPASLIIPCAYLFADSVTVVSVFVSRPCTVFYSCPERLEVFKDCLFFLGKNAKYSASCIIHLEFQPEQKKNYM